MTGKLIITHDDTQLGARRTLGLRTSLSPHNANTPPAAAPTSPTTTTPPPAASAPTAGSAPSRAPVPAQHSQSECLRGRLLSSKALCLSPANATHPERCVAHRHPSAFTVGMSDSEGDCRVNSTKKYAWARSRHRIDNVCGSRNRVLHKCAYTETQACCLPGPPTERAHTLPRALQNACTHRHTPPVSVARP